MKRTSMYNLMLRSDTNPFVGKNIQNKHVNDYYFHGNDAGQLCAFITLPINLCSSIRYYVLGIFIVWLQTLSKRFFFRISKITVDCVEENQMKYDIISSSYEGIKIKCALKVKCTYAKLNAKLRRTAWTLSAM